MTLGWNLSVGSSWSRDDDTAFERALAIYEDETQICWENIAAVVPGKTTELIIEHYNILIRDVMDIESGRVPLPDYGVPDEPNPYARGKGISIGDNSRKSKQKGKEKHKHKRQKGVAWTSNEHRQFLLGLAKYGKGDWRSISRNSVRTRTPTQVASHAQKYFQRLNSKNKHRNRPSIHDITVDEENRNISPEQGAIGTWQNGNVNLASTSNNQAIQTTSKPSLDLPVHRRPNIWNTQALSQPSVNLPTYGAPTIWNAQAALPPPPPPPCTIWNAQAALPPPPPASIPVYGTTLSSMNQPMVGQMPSHFGTNMNHFAQPHMTPGVQHYPLPSYPGHSAPINMGSSIPYGDKTYATKSQR
ncbi:PREDICTED: transcription factor DIVARICATA-like [Camelina sativa]|uniref:Transcription factor DIVARICATA-like n=1 Tax=Camelina sativa TaxID=90675 RepID=A0ABM0TCM7_CAMSA|nr:PREDICTED: transcription factor DIVARICATA-like [Camelina sativa]